MVARGNFTKLVTSTRKEARRENVAKTSKHERNNLKGV